MHKRGVRQHCIGGRRHRRLCRVIHFDPVGGVARGGRIISNDHRDPLAHKSDNIRGKGQAPGAITSRSAHILRHHLRLDRSKPVGHPVLACKHGDNMGRRLRPR